MEGSARCLVLMTNRSTPNDESIDARETAVSCGCHPPGCVLVAPLERGSVAVWIKARRLWQPAISRIAAHDKLGSDPSLVEGDRPSCCGRRQPTPFWRFSGENCNDLRRFGFEPARPLNARMPVREPSAPRSKLTPPMKQMREQLEPSSRQLKCAIRMPPSVWENERYLRAVPDVRAQTASRCASEEQRSGSSSGRQHLRDGSSHRTRTLDGQEPSPRLDHSAVRNANRGCNLFFPPRN